ncbi:MAG: DUF6786 family protein [Planctomycetota bacterium]
MKRNETAVCRRDACTTTVLAILLMVFLGGCEQEQKGEGEMKKGAATFGDDVQFLKKHMDILVLSDKEGQAQVAVSPGLQGRVMTSAAAGTQGASFGWINRELIASGKKLEHFNPLGGEERFWMGPEGGQFSIFFAKGAAFDLAHWYVPAAIDTEPFEVVSKSAESAKFSRKCQFVNYSGTKFDVDISREIRLLAPDEVWPKLGVPKAGGVKMAAFESVNRITNAGKEAWKKDTGQLSIWILCMFNPSPTTTIVVPIKPGAEKDLGPQVNADYFGRVPPERLIVKENVVFFSADGKCRGKIGVNPKRCKAVLGSYDSAGKVLTLAQFTFDPGRTDYVNSMWKIQDDPFAGDTANSYNDGPPAPGVKPMGPFYEIESSSPAAALEPGKTLEHVHRTIHLQGPAEQLDAIAQAVLGVGIKEIEGAFKK